MLVLLFPAAAFSSAPIIDVSDDFKGLDLLPYASVLEDPGGTLTLEQIRQPEHGARFVPLTQTGNSFGFSRSAYWLRFSVRVSDAAQHTLLLELGHASIDDVVFYAQESVGVYSSVATGEARPFASREVPHRSFVFRLPAQSGQLRTHYLRLASEGSVQIPLSLWSANAFIEYLDRVNLLFGIYFGVMLLLTLAALASYVRLRDRLFAYYAFYLFSYLLFQASITGFSYQYFWPGWPSMSSRFTSAFVGLAVIGALVFSASFLDIRKRQPMLFWVYRLHLTLALLTILLSLLGDYVLAVKAAALVGLSLPPVVFVATLASVLGGYRPARYFLAGWSIFLTGIFSAGLLHLGLLPHRFVTAYSMQIGSTLEVLLLTYALTEKIDGLRRAKEQALAQANTYMNQLNSELERMVAERTAELTLRNQRLAELARLDSMTGLLNHRSAMQELDSRTQDARAQGQELAVLMFDIDRFKSINDRYGHPIGDKVIESVAAILKDVTTEHSLCGRMGGEEFMLIVPGLGRVGALKLGQGIRRAVAELEIREAADLRITVSVGIAVMRDLPVRADLIRAADRALYQAKTGGRDQVRVAA